MRRSLYGLRVDLERGRCLPFLLLTRVSHVSSPFCFLFSFGIERRGRKDPPLLRVGCQRIYDSVRCFSEALMALARSLRRGYYHIWLHARVILAQEAVLVS